VSPAHLDRRRTCRGLVQNPDDLLFAEALPLHGEPSCRHRYQENSHSAWTDSRGEAQNQRWSLDFAADVLSDGRRLRILVVVDDFSRECLALVADRSLTGQRVARELDRIAALRGLPLMIVSDNGTELTSHAILGWQAGTRRCLALHRARQADAERPGREPDRPAAR
jgi:transposase InsO family protein